MTDDEYLVEAARRFWLKSWPECEPLAGALAGAGVAPVNPRPAR